MLLCAILLVLATMPCTDQLHTQTDHALSKGLIQKGSSTNMIQYRRSSTSDSGSDKTTTTWTPLTFVAAQSSDELPTPSTPELTFINISSVNISWHFDFSVVDSARNVCFGIEYQNNAKTANMSLICGGNYTFYVFPWLMSRQKYRFKVIATDGVTTTISGWSYRFVNGIEAPPGPPQNFRARVESDTEINLSWDSLMISNQVAYEICWNALTPVCVDGPTILEIGNTIHRLVELRPATLFYFKIRATLGPFYSIWSDWINATTHSSKLPTPSTPELTFINISSVNISWHFDFSTVDPARNVCFGIEYENNTRIANVSSLICGRKCTFYVFPWLLYGQIYRFKVIATDGVITTFSDWSYQFINGAKELPTPSTPELTFINISSVNISWHFNFSAISPAQNVCFGIEYENNTRIANVSSLICGGNRTFYVFPWLLRGQRYRFKVIATDGVTTKIGNWSFAFIDGVEAPPGPPQNFTAQVKSDTEIDLSWDSLIIINQVAYEICWNARTPVCVDGPTILTIRNTFHLAELRPATVYYFEIRASMGHFYSIWSDWINATTYSSKLPTPSTPELTFINISSVNISWHFDFSVVSPARNVCFGIEYENNTRIANVSSLICGRNHTFYVFPWLLRRQSYRFKVIATDGVTTTTSGWSYQFVNGVEAPPGPPQNFVAQGESDMEIDLSWDSLMISNQVAYEICWNALTPVCVDGPTILEIGNTFHRLVGLRPATMYYFKIRASVGPFYSIWSDWINATTHSSTFSKDLDSSTKMWQYRRSSTTFVIAQSSDELPTPSTPELTFINISSVNISWHFDFSAVDPARNVCFGIEYENNTRIANVSLICGGNCTFYVFPWLLYGQIYRFKVIATDGVTTTFSDWSYQFINGAKELPTPSTPELTFINVSSVNISWDFDFSAVSPAQNVCFGIEYENNTRIANVSSLICGGNCTFYVFPWLLRGQRYRFKVIATDGVATTIGNWSVVFINGIDAPPGPPQNFTAQVKSDTEIDLSWDSLIIINQVAYEICWNALTPVCVDGPTILTLNTSHQLVGLQPATVYYFEIRASVGHFYSIWSDWINATTHSSKLPTPSTPELTFINISSVNISWHFDFSAVEPARNVCFGIEYKNNTKIANVSLICGGNRTFYVFPWLLYGQIYRFKVIATDGVTTTISDWSYQFINGAKELPTPSAPELTFINISVVNISWHFDFSAVSPAQNVCFGIEYENNTRIANVSSLICGGNRTFYVFPWLLRDQKYRIKVIATDGVTTTFGNWSFAFINGVKELPTPSTPELTFINISSVNISWHFDFSAVSPARNVCFGIEYENNTRIANVSSLICGRNHTFYVFPWLLYGQIYRFKVIATDGMIYTISDWSYQFINGAKELPTPSTPELTFINISSIYISWDFDFSAVSPAQNVCFGIEYQNNTRIANVSSLICGGNHTFFVFPWLLFGQWYRFKVIATDGVTTKISKWSFGFINGIEAPPGPPQNFRAQVESDTEIDLSWEISLIDKQTAYEVCWNELTPVCVDGPTILTFGTRYRLVELRPATVYYFEIRASFASFYSIWSDWINATTHSSTLPVIILNRDSVEVNSTYVYVHWDPVHQKLLKYTFREYFIDIVTGTLDPHMTPNYTTSNVSMNITGLQPSTDYHIAVGYYVTDNDGNRIASGLSDIVNVTTLHLYHQPVITCTQCEALSTTALQISWKIKSDADHITNSYAIFKDDSGDYTRIANVSVSVTVFNITELHPNRGYKFAVQPLSDTINGSKSDCPEDSCRTKQAVPEAPRNVQVSPLNSTSLLVSWDDPAENDGEILHFTVHYFCANTNRCKDYDRQSTTAEHNLTVTGLHPYTPYTFVIYGWSVAGEGQGSRSVTMWTLEAAPDDTPQSLTAHRLFPTYISLQWSAPLLEHRNGIIIGYKVSWRLQEQSSSSSSSSKGTLLGTKNVTFPTVTIVDLNTSTSYKVSVAAFTAVGIGPSANTTVSTTDSQYNLKFSAALVKSTDSKYCQDIKLYWNLLPGIDSVLYIVSVLPFEDEENKTHWTTTTENDSVIVPHNQLAVGEPYEAELKVVMDTDPSSSMDVITSQLLNITLPACSKPKDSTVLWSCVGGGMAVVMLVLLCICCTICCYRRHKYKLLQQVRKPVGGAAEVIEGEEVALLGQATSMGSTTTSSNDSIGGDVPMLKVDTPDTDTPSDDMSSLGDMALVERPLPLGAEDS